MAELNVNFLRKQILEMGALAEKILSFSLVSENSLNDIFIIEDEINRYHKQIDDDVFKYIALKAPHATDLRTALAVMKMNSELERMGDQSVNIKRYNQKLTTTHPLLDTLQDEVLQMVKKSLDAFSTSNTNLAADVIKSDKEVNAIHREIIREYFRKMKEEAYPFEEGFAAMRVAKNLERIGDHSTNICEDVIFLDSGHDIRHNPEKKNERV